MDAEIIKLLKDHGFSREDIQLMMDLSNKIQNDTMELVERVSDSAPEHLRMQVTLLGFMAIEHRLKHANRVVRDTFRELGISHD